MARILVLDSDDAFALRVSRGLAELGHRTGVSTSLEGAVARLTSEPHDVVVSSIRLGDDRVTPLLEWMLRTHHRTRFVVFGDATTIADCRAMLRLGVVDLLPRTAQPCEFAQAVDRALELGTGWRCDLHGIALFDVLQTLHLARRSSRLVLSSESPGLIDMLEGEIVHAAHGEMVGESALASMVMADNGRVSSFPKCGGERTIRRNFEALMLELLRQLDEGLAPSAVRVRHSTMPPTGLTPLLGAIASAARRHAVTEPPAPANDEAVSTSPNGVIDAACEMVVRSVDGALACAVIDLETGALRGMSDVEDSLAIGMRDRMREAASSLRARRHSAGSPADGVSGHSYQEVESVHLTTAHESQFLRALRTGRSAVALLTRRGFDVGLGSSLLDWWLPVVESVCADNEL